MAGAALGPLHGVPTAIKDLFDFKPGWPATFGGVRALEELQRRTAYCTFAERIEKAGAIILGKTNSPVMGFRGTCDNYLFGPARNPSTARNTGGSSGGSAAAVADGLLPFAEGTDGGGSIRIPASWCGVYGYKASFGRVPMHRAPERLRRRRAVPLRGRRSPARSRTPPWR